MAATRVRFETSMGSLVIETFSEEAPLTAENFLEYVKSGFYDGTIFHRVIPGFVVQGGGMSPGMDQKRTRDPIRNEAAKAPKNLRGSLSMARTNDPHSATSQFFINLVDNKSLDAGGPSGAGYCVFGKIVEGMEVVDAMAKVRTTRRPPHADVPAEDIVLVSAKILED
ncbi:MAG TPA: peptidylprolyl isomerase [Rectinemataceae bacterium]|nr:peptidylprolyl isomerase [Rectinemataceae bacterium]